MIEKAFFALIDNPIFETTGWTDHEKLAVKAGRCRYNGNLVDDEVRIIQLDRDDFDALHRAERLGEPVDPSDFEGTHIVTNVAGARALAALLTAIADKVEGRS